MKYCLIGEKLGHSYSKTIHEYMGLEYGLEEIDRGNLEIFFKHCDYKGFNVTIPYKREVIPYMEQLDPVAQKAGAVNTVLKIDGKFYGYNTDVGGMKYMISSVGVCLKDKTVMILGSGGTSGTARTLCQTEGAKSVTVVSRSGEVNYQNCYQLKDTQIIINTTPVGMFPNVEQRPIELNKFPKLEGVFDCIYNPKTTELLDEAKKLGLPCSDGLPMLVEQALLAEDIWLGVKHESEKTKEIVGEIRKNTVNIVLSGMASCGKSTLGKEIANVLGKEYFDSDLEIERLTGKTPSDIISLEGEEAFREIESKVVCELAKKSGVVISLGGGAVLRERNVHALKRNGVICFIRRDLSLLTSQDRPLSQRDGIANLYAKRKEIYEKTADFTVENDREILAVSKEIIEKYESSCN